MDSSLVVLLSQADQAIGRLDGMTELLPNPDLFLAMYVRREAVLSSQIEGTQSSLDDVLTFELDPRGVEVPQDVEEVVNYVHAMNYGLDRLTAFPLSLRLIREIHGHLLQGVRGSERHPGAFRTSQNWIGPANVSLAHATFVPPPVANMHEALDNFERFLHQHPDMPVLTLCALAHAQFETIHPFLDGNGRVGRLLITFLLVHRSVLRRPLLYLSYYLKRHRTEYYDRLMAVREQGDWEGWLRFFLRGVTETAQEATSTARTILTLREQHRALVQEQRLGINGARLLDVLFRQPVINVNLVKESLNTNYTSASRLIDRFEEAGLLAETTGGQRNRRYRYMSYLTLFNDEQNIVADVDVSPVQSTESGPTG